MQLHISFEPNIGEPSGSRLVLNVGNVSVRSYPMSVDDHYRDLLAIRHFLVQRRLSSMFFGDEPMAEVELSSESNLVKLTPYGGPGAKRVSGEFDLDQALNHIEHILHELAGITKADKDSLQRQVAADIDDGVYDVFLSNGRASD